MNRISIEELTISLESKKIVEISFEIDGSLALVGESGSGKSLTLKALLGLNDSSFSVVLKRTIPFDWILGKTVGFVPQNPFTALSPLTKIKQQMFASQERCQTLFEMLDLPLSLLNRYPNELSGGQLQRVIVAMALVSEPKVLLLDEPTTALDSESKERMIEWLMKMQKSFGFSMLLVTHDMNVASKMCSNICIIRHGKVIEAGKMIEVLANPQEDYTKMLIDAEFTKRGFRS